MATETHTGTLNFGDGQVAMDDGTVLAVAGSPTPCATAVAQYAKYGETQPVTVTSATGEVDNQSVLFVTSIQWAAPADFLPSTPPVLAAATSSVDGTAAAPALAKKSARSRKKK